MVQDDCRAVASFYDEDAFEQLHHMDRLVTDCRQLYLGGGLNSRTAWWQKVETQAHWSVENYQRGCNLLNIDDDEGWFDKCDTLGTEDSEEWDAHNMHPIFAILQRSPTCERGEAVNLGDCRRVIMDEGERKLMDKAEEITAYYFREILCLHAQHLFTHVCAPDGSRKIEQGTLLGKLTMVKKVAWGYYCHLQHAKALA